MKRARTSAALWPPGYLPDLPEVEVPTNPDGHQLVTFNTDDETDANPDDDTTITFSTDDETMPKANDVPTLEAPSDDNDHADSPKSEDSEIPTGYNSETGELYQNQLADKVVYAKYMKQFM